MKQSMLALSTAALAGTLYFGCSLDEIDLEGKACPCADGWQCDATTNTCHRPGAVDGGGSGGTEGGLGGTGASGTGASGGVGGVGGVGGTGGTGQCSAGQKLCGTACVSTTSATFGCAASSCDPCPSGINANASCSAGLCALSCSTGFGDCDGVASTGCEQSLENDSANCGKCGRACVAANANASACTGTSCLPSCNPGFADCNESSKPDPDDGCETNVGTSADHCGACGNACTLQGGATTKFQCFSGVCGCSAAADCTLTANIQGAACDASHVCSCSATLCRPGEVCAKDGPGAKCSCNGGNACTSAQVCCPSAGCVDLGTSAQNCGACGNACPSGQTCTAGVCG